LLAAELWIKAEAVLKLFDRLCGGREVRENVE